MIIINYRSPKDLNRKAVTVHSDSIEEALKLFRESKPDVLISSITNFSVDEVVLEIKALAEGYISPN